DEFEVFKPLLSDRNYTPIVRRKPGGKEQKLVYGPGGTVATEDTTPAERSTFTLTDDELLTLARWACTIERHYGGPMDMEWAKDGLTGELFIVQARPETIHSQTDDATLRTYRLTQSGERLVTGAAIGDAIASGVVCRIDSPTEIAQFQDGAVLVTTTTDPDWAPIMKKASAIVTDHGGRTSHAAIVSRELGLPAVIGAGDATELLTEGATVTVSCAEGETGYVYGGAIPFITKDIALSDVPETHTKVMLNAANPAAAYRWWRLPSDGVGLTRLEFIISNSIKVHPLALLRPDAITDEKTREEIDALTMGYDDKTAFFVDRLTEGVARIAAAHYPHPVIVRMSDFKTNEYAKLLGGAAFEPKEENPMLGWRGASRYYHPDYREGFSLECAAMRRVRNDLGLKNIKLMIPFCRTPEEADKVLAEMAANGLERGAEKLEILVMAEIPSNVFLADEFADRFDGFSIGSNDLTQLVLGVDRDSADLQDLFDERNDAVKAAIKALIIAAAAKKTPVGICGQGPSDYPDFAAFLVENGIQSISVSPESFITVKNAIAAAERDTAR
ncbi:MAG: phosphoenolpyruvate synthase, partial [Pseudomonadota bacterium]